MGGVTGGMCECVYVYTSACVGIYMCECVLVCIFLYACIVVILWWLNGMLGTSHNTVAHATHSDIYTHRKTCSVHLPVSLKYTKTQRCFHPHPTH